MKIEIGKKGFLALAAVLIMAIGLGYLAGGGRGPSGDGTAMQGQDEKKPVFFRNPMNPAITSPVPAKDEMGMDYIPVYAGEEPMGPAGTVTIDPVAVQNIGVRTAKAQRRTLSREVRAVGRVAFDEERVTRLHPKIEGWIEKLYVDKTGEQVKKGTILLGIYSPQLVTTQEEYILAVKNADALKDSPFADIRKGAEELVVSTRQRLQLLDVPEHQIRELEQTGQVKKTLHIHSPFDGVVVRMGARDGQFVTPKTELYTIADLSKVWVYVDVFEQDLPWVKAGDQAEMRLTGLPGQVFGGVITYIYPYAEADTRTVKVRLEFDNKKGLLKPEMFADVTIHAGREVDAVVVPAEAVVRSGAREQVFVVREPGKFEPREVRLGITAEGWTQVLSGVSAGEEVVTSAQFLIDSESKLREATAKMMEAQPAGDMSGHDMSGHDMPGMEMPKPDPHAGHDMSGMEMPEADPHAGHDMSGMKMPEADPHAGHDMSGSGGMQ